MTEEFRCQSCKRLLLRGRVEKIEIKCPRCGCVQTFLRTGQEICCCIHTTDNKHMDTLSEKTAENKKWRM